MKSFILFLLSLCQLSWTATAKAGTLEETLSELSIKAQNDDATAQYRLGILYAKELEDEKQAIEWLTRAAQNGHSFAQYNLGVRYAKGRGVQKDDAVALQWWKKAAAQGNRYAQYNLGVNEMERNILRGYSWLYCAAEQGDEDAKNIIKHLEQTMSPAQLEEARDLSQTYHLVYVPGTN